MLLAGVRRVAAGTATMSIEPAGVLQKQIGVIADVQALNAHILESAMSYFLDSLSRGQRSKVKNVNVMDGINELIIGI